MDIPLAPSPEAIVSVSVIKTGTVACDRRHIVAPSEPDKIQIPVLAFLIERKGLSYTFDLGLRPDLFVVPEHIQDIEYPYFWPDAKAPLPGSLPPDVVIDTAFISHYHWDHIGDPSLLAKGTPVVLGRGSLEAIGKGYPTGDPWISPHWLDHCQFQEVEFDSGPIGNFPKSKDWFGDGSLWFIDCPGHCAGNMSALARVTASPDTYVLLGGDCCHDQALYVAPCAHSIGSYKMADGQTMTLHEDHTSARENMLRLHEMSKRDDIMVILAHEREIEGIIPLLSDDLQNRGVLKEWKSRGWKQAKIRPELSADTDGVCAALTATR